MSAFDFSYNPGGIMNINFNGDNISNTDFSNIFDNNCDISWIPKGSKVTAISFDDGPVSDSDNAIRIFNALNENGFHATFFYWGEKIHEAPEEISLAAKLGFEVGNHAWSHPDLRKLNDKGYEEIEKCRKELGKILSEDTHYLLRPPYLSYDDEVLKAAGVPVITCRIDTEDWNNASKEMIFDRLNTALEDGTIENSIVLCHAPLTTTADAVEAFLPVLKSKGYINVSISEMFRFNSSPLLSGKVYSGCDN